MSECKQEELVDAFQQVTALNHGPLNIPQIKHPERIKQINLTRVRAPGVGAASPVSPKLNTESKNHSAECKTPTSNLEFKFGPADFTKVPLTENPQKNSQMRKEKSLQTSYNISEHIPRQLTLPTYTPSKSYLRLHGADLSPPMNQTLYLTPSFTRKPMFSVPKLCLPPSPEFCRFCPLHDGIHSNKKFCKIHWKREKDTLPCCKETAISWWQPLSEQPTSSLPEPRRDIIRKLASQRDERERKVFEAITNAEQRAKAERKKYYDRIKRKSKKRRHRHSKTGEHTRLLCEGETIEEKQKGTRDKKSKRLRDCFTLATLTAESAREKNLDTRRRSDKNHTETLNNKRELKPYHKNVEDDQSPEDQENVPDTVIKRRLRTMFYGHKESGDESTEVNKYDASLNAARRPAKREASVNRLHKKCERLEKQLKVLTSGKALLNLDNEIPTIDSFTVANMALRRRLNELQSKQVERDASFRDVRAKIEELMSKQQQAEENIMQNKTRTHQDFGPTNLMSASTASWISAQKAQPSKKSLDKQTSDYLLSSDESDAGTLVDCSISSLGNKYEPLDFDWTGRFENMNHRASTMKRKLKQLKTDYKQLAQNVVQMEEKARQAATSVQTLISRTHSGSTVHMDGHEKIEHLFHGSDCQDDRKEFYFGRCRTFRENSPMDENRQIFKTKHSNKNAGNLTYRAQRKPVRTYPNYALNCI